MYLVSVIVPTYNRASLLPDTLKSILGQTYTNIEIIVADDGSTDQTESIVQNFPASIRYVRQAHRGHDGASRNLGVRHSRGDLIAFVDSDDLWAPTKLERQVALFQAQPELGLVYTDGWCFEGTTDRKLYTLHRFTKPQVGWVGPDLLQGNFIPTSSTMIRRTALESVGFFNEDPVLHLRSDWEMWLRIAARFPVGYSAERLFDYRLHAHNTTRREDPLIVHRSCMRAIQCAVSFAPELYRPVYRKALAAQCSHTASGYVASGRLREARAMYAQALRLNPHFYPAYPFALGTLFGSRAARRLSHAYMWWLRRRSGRPPGV